MTKIAGIKKIKSWAVAIKAFIVGFMLMFAAAYSFAGTVSIVSAVSSKGNCYVAGQNLTITINASITTPWAALDPLVIGSPGALTYNNDGGELDDCLWGLTGTTGNAPNNISPWKSTASIGIPSGTGITVAGYQIIVPVPASYTLVGPKTFYVVIADTSSQLTLGEYYVSNPIVSAPITLSECSLDTPTYTLTPTATVPHLCNTGSAMYGATAVVCVNILNSTPTFTPTYTVTNTRTATPTYTPTYTQTVTNTFTSTYTATPTFTMTYTRTATPTFTNTVSSDTPTSTYTATPTYTPTPTYTDTTSPTFTPTDTPTYTATSTSTSTPTYTATYTVSNTTSPTDTPTFTDTFTASPTYTATYTVSNTTSPTFTPTFTSTFTDTPTFTATPTETVTDTYTSTYTDTPTFTDTYTQTYTSTYTDTPTFTPTFTQTYTYTETPTVTPTPPPFPYMLTIGVYNEAGELVRTVADTPTEEMIGNIQFLINSQQDKNGTMTTDNPLQILLPGLQTPNTPLGQPDTSYFWNATTDANQQVSSGVYYIKFQQTDGYGHTNVVIKEIDVLNTNQYAEVDIFNSAGEKVRTMYVYKDVSNTQLTLKAPDVIPIDSNGNTVTITYGTGLTDYLTWNGLNDQGVLVQSGTYEVQVNLVTNQGRTTVASKTVIVLTQTKKFTGDVEIWPNPYVGGKNVAKQVKLVWVPGLDTGTMNVAIYNLAGELVRQWTADLQAASIVWDLKTGDESDAASGLYVVVFKVKDTLGSVTIKTLKMTLQNH